MRLLLLFLLTFAAALHADEILFSSYSCAITIPAGETWEESVARQFTGGETIYIASHPEKNEVFSLNVLPHVPAFDVHNEGVASLALRTLSGFGMQSSPPKAIQVNGIDYLQFIAKKAEAPGAICVARASLREKTLYLMMMFGPGDASKAEDKQFLRVLDTFRYADPTSDSPPLTANPLFYKYQKGAFVCVGAAGAIALLFCAVMFFTRRPSH